MDKNTLEIVIVLAIFWGVFGRILYSSHGWLFPGYAPIEYIMINLNTDVFIGRLLYAILAPLHWLEIITIYPIYRFLYWLIYGYEL